MLKLLEDYMLLIVGIIGFSLLIALGLFVALGWLLILFIPLPSWMWVVWGVLLVVDCYIYIKNIL